MMAMAAEDGKTMITLRSSDGEEFEVEAAAAKQSVMIGNMIEDGCSEGGIPLPNVTSKVLAKILEYCKKHADFAAGNASGHDGRAATKEDMAAWDADYINVEQDVLYDVIVVRFLFPLPLSPDWFSKVGF